MKVVVTGAGGFIGRAVAERFRAEGSEVVGVDLAADPDRGVTEGDVSAAGPWQAAFAGAQVVIHTAAIVSNAYDLSESWRVNVLGTRNALDAAAAAGVERFVHISSVRAFSDLGFPDGVDEQHPVRPDGNPYVDTKIASEQVVLQAHAAGEVDCVVVRPADVYGPGSRPWTMLPLEFIEANRFLLPAMGNGVFSPVYLDDLVTGLMLAAERADAGGQVFTIGGARGVATKEFFGHYYRMLGKRGPVCLPTPLAVAAARAGGTAQRLRGRRTELNAASMRYLARPGGYSIEKARRVLGYEPLVDLDEGMRRTEAWLREQRLLPISLRGSRKNVRVLLEAVVSRSRRDLWLAAQPALMLAVLLGGLWLTVLLPPAAALPARLAIAALWSWWSARLLPARAHEVAAWLRTRVVERGGEGYPAQPVRPPTALEANVRNAPAMLVSLEAVRLAFMRHPGQESRRLLAVAGAALWLPALTRTAIEDHGTIARAATVLCAAIAAVATADLYRGRQRSWSRPWRGADGPWPRPWAVADRPSKLLGPIWLALVALGLAATVPISNARSLGHGVTLAFLLLAPVTTLWMGRQRLGWLATLERTGAHRRLARGLVRLAPAAWLAALAVQVALVAAGVVAIALTPLDDSASYLGILILGIALMLRAVRREWQRPRQPTVVELGEVAALFGERHLERRISGVLLTASFVSGAWAYVLTAAG